MSMQCRQFVQNAWKKELCSNCFKPREEHNNVQDAIRPSITHSVKRVAHKVQGILCIKESSHSQVRPKRKNVAFPESLAEIIGYDGGDDFDCAEDNDEQRQDDTSDDPDCLGGDANLDVDELPDSEEERALGNLTRANTNFNTVTANLMGTIEEARATSKSFSTLMLGRAQKDAEGKKTTLLVTVKPFGGDDSVPTARRPSDKKSPEFTKPKTTSESLDAKTELSPPKTTKKTVNEKPSENASITSSKVLTSTTSLSSFDKIVDMPLITSTNLMSVMSEESPHTLETQKSTTTITEHKRTTSIARTPAIKKSEIEKPRIIAQQNINQNIARNYKNLEMSNGVELNLSPIGTKEESIAESTKFGKDALSYKTDFASNKSANIADLTERKVEGEAAKEKYHFEESRESAGEPDGKADEEVVAEPPALPKSPPPLETSANPYGRSCLEADKRISSSSIAEPRASFLHGVSESKVKPTVPQKPVALPSKPLGAASLASLLSEHRAYEYRLSQRNNALVHSQSETQLCGVGEVGVKSRLANEQDGLQKMSAESCSHLTHMETFKNGCAKSNGKEEQNQSEDLEADDDEDDCEALSTDQSRSSGKRRMAPQPPNSTLEEASSNLFARNSTSSTVAKSDCPVVREKEKRERASSCSPKFREAVCEAPDPSASRPPEPAPRRNISLSQDSLAAATTCERVVEEKKKARSKFSLKKFLRMGSRKDVDMTGGSSGSRNDEIPSTPQPKPRLEIIHPLELDGAAVQVLRNDKSCSEDTTDSKNENHSSSSQTVHTTQHIAPRPSKPPPPPRTQSLDESARSTSRASPPKQQQQQQQQSNNNSKPLVGKSWQPSGGSSASDSIYANLAAEDVAGAIRSALAPAKPRRTSSMRDQQPAPQPNNGRNLGLPRPAAPGLLERQRTAPSDSMVSSESQQSHDRLLTSSEYEDSTSLELRQVGIVNHPITKRQSDSGALESNSSELKFQQTLFTRSTSLPYCASEAESEIYSPFSCYPGDEGSEDSQEWKKDEESRIGRLRQRRGRSIVHRSLEDNYGAVIVANHEALAQFLEQTNQAPQITAGLRGLKTAANLRFSHFIIERSTAMAAGRRIFFSATWNEQNCTVCVAFGPSMHASRKDFYLVPIVEFIDDVPKDIVEMGCSIGRKSFQATISVLPRLQVNTLKSFAETLSAEPKEENATRESSFVLLQLVSALKSLQARGIEEAPRNLTNVVLCREDKEAYHRLYLFQGLNIDNSENNEDEYVSLCQCALNALEELNFAKKLPLIEELLMREKAVTLSQVKSLLEFTLWGPADAALGGPRERETALQHWLDLERATVLHALVRARAQLTVTDEYQLLFLVRTSAKIMCEASLLIDRQRNGLLARV